MKNFTVVDIYFNQKGEVAVVEAMVDSGAEPEWVFKRICEINPEEAKIVEAFAKEKYAIDICLFPKKTEESSIEKNHPVPAAFLPGGWKWEKWPDGSGHLRDPDNEVYFSYDMLTNEAKDIFGVWQWEDDWVSFFERKEKEILKYLKSGFPSKRITATKRLGRGYHDGSEVMVGHIDIAKVVENLEGRTTPVVYTENGHILSIHPITVETGYEFFENSHEIRLDDVVMWGEKGLCVGPYKIIRIPTGNYADEGDAIAYIKKIMERRK